MELIDAGWLFGTLVLLIVYAWLGIEGILYLRDKRKTSRAAQSAAVRTYRPFRMQESSGHPGGDPMNDPPTLR